jgi:flagellar basal-body rod protein FlgC
MNFDALDISASALYAQRIKMDTIASNIANVNTTRKPDGTPGVYKRKDAIFAAVYNETAQNNNQKVRENNDESTKAANNDNSLTLSMGVKVLEIAEDDETPLKKIYNPSHPDSDPDGYVNLPNVNVVTEMVDMISASRAYEANVTTINATKSMISAAMKI